MYMAPDSWKGLYESLLQQVSDGRVAMARLDEAVLRILSVKLRAGLFDAGLPSARPATGRSALGRDTHRAVAREAVRKSLVLLKNNDRLLPFAPGAHIAVIGEAAKSMSQQTGGWTLSWQGDDNANTEFETGQTIYDGLKEKIDAAGGTISYAATADAITGTPDLVIFVYGEKPYAEFKGDMSDAMFEFDDGPALATLDKLNARGLPVVSVFLTGRPLWVNQHINRSDAFVVAWLPGTEAGGIADVLAANANGAAVYDFTGKLSFSWPSDGRGIPIDSDSQSGVQFSYGHGLSYATAPQKMAALSQAAGIAAPRGDVNGVLLARGAAEQPFGLFLGDSSNWRTPAAPFLSTSLGDVVRSRGVDYRAQEDARRLSWRGTGRGVVSLQTQRGVDLSALGAAENLHLVMHYRLDQAPDKAVKLAMGCGDNCGAMLDVTAPIAKAEPGKWQTLAIPFACFTQSGLDQKRVTAPFILETHGAMEISLTRIELVEPKTPHRAPCP